MSIPFAAAFTYCVAMRFVELAVSRSHERRLMARGARRIRPDATGVLVAVHTLWFVGLLTEHFLLGPVSLPASVTYSAWSLALVAEAVRLWCVLSLGDHWNVAVIVLPGAPLVRRGPYRWVRHPNYLAVILLLVALPVALGLLWTALFILPLKLIALRQRLKIENQALAVP